MHNDKYIFYFTLLNELIFLPFIYLLHWIKVLFCCIEQSTKQRTNVESKKVQVVVHEWGGYPAVRNKTIKNGETFSCGLKGQLERFKDIEKFDLTITLSDAHLHLDLETLKSTYAVLQVNNEGMDFSGYSAFWDTIKYRENSYVILTNSSVNAIQENFIGNYVKYMEQNPDIGMLGVSYCTKTIQTLIRCNFTPHLQSFFLLTTTNVLREVVKINGEKFPGAGINHKLLLIRKGEIRISKLVAKLGYRLAVVNPIDGVPYKFECYKNWKLPFGDIRQQINTPNRITPIKNDSSVDCNI